MKWRCSLCGQYFDNYEYVKQQSFLEKYEDSYEISYCPYCDHLFVESYTQWLIRRGQKWL